MTESGQSPAQGPSVCPFVALAEDRDRRADSPDESNRCYAERAPRQRDLSYQADFCYSRQFSACSVFLAWAARNAAEPAYVTEAAKMAWASGIAAPGDGDSGATETDAEPLPTPTPEGGLFGPPDPSESEGAPAARENVDWVSASAWAEAPWDDRAEQEADELEVLAREEAEEEPEVEEEEHGEEATTAPKVPAAVPMRRRKPAEQPIRSPGSGEWYYADPPGRDPLVQRRSGIAPPILLGVLGLLVITVVVFLVATQIPGGGDDGPGAAASPTPRASQRPVATRAPIVSAAPSLAPSPTPPQIKTYTVKPGDALASIAAKRGVDMKLLQCMNRIMNPNVIVVGQVLRIPPDGYSCPAGWRKSTPEPFE